MKILLVHSSEPEIYNKVQKWKKKRTSMGQIYQMSLVGVDDYDSLKDEDKNDLVNFVYNQIIKSKSIYSIEKVLLVNIESLDLIGELNEKFRNSKIKFKVLNI